MTTQPSPARVRLTGAQWRKLTTVLTQAYPRYHDLQQLLQFELGLDLQVEIAGPGPVRDVLFDIITYTEARNRTLELVEAALRNRPNLPDLLALAQELRIVPDSSSLERTLRAANIVFDSAQFRQRLAEIERQVCRIERDGQPLGTGFLIGPEAVLTNYHVVEDLIAAKPGVSPTRFALRFDYRLLDDGQMINAGIRFALADDWHIDSSPYSPLDAQSEPKPADPAIDQLDYAVLRVAGRPGDDSASKLPDPGDTPARGYVALPAPGQPYGFSANRVLFIVQHPFGHPLKITANTFRSINGNQTRITYLNDTNAGSSGSPCFNANWKLVALHHSGDPAFAQPQYNQGIPIQAVVQLLHQRGKLDAILLHTGA